jgi:hypothetical protein
LLRFFFIYIDLYIIFVKKIVMEKETLEELYLNQLINEISRGFLLDKKTAKEVAIKYSKWQQEQMYSEEDMLLAFETGRNFQLTGENNFKELIEQLKK